MKNEIEPPKEAGNRDPFMIRAHHLDSSYKYLAKPECSTKTISPPEKVVDVFIHCSLDSPNLSINYIEDLFGKTDKSRDEFTRKLLKNFELFISLPDDYPAKITDGFPDGICEACANGKHCKQVSAVEIQHPGNMLERIVLFPKLYLIYVATKNKD